MFLVCVFSPEGRNFFETIFQKKSQVGEKVKKKHWHHPQHCIKRTGQSPVPECCCSLLVTGCAKGGALLLFRPNLSFDQGGSR